MEIFQLQCFLSVVDRGSFTGAAVDVSMSQSALSKNISKLESELDVKLFDRSRRVAVLTPAGREFERHARKLICDYGEMRQEMKQYISSGHLHIGSVDHLGRVGITTPIASFLNQHPDGGVQIDIEISDTLTLLNRLLEEKVDMAFIAQISSERAGASNTDGYDLSRFRLYTLVRDTYHVIVNQQHPLARRSSLSWKDLTDEKLVILDKSFSINGIIRQCVESHGKRPKIAFECEQVDTILGMVEGNFGISLLSRRVADARYQVCAIPMEEPILRNTVLVVPKQAEQKQLLVHNFVHHILDYYESND